MATTCCHFLSWLHDLCYQWNLCVFHHQYPQADAYYSCYSPVCEWCKCKATFYFIHLCSSKAFWINSLEKPLSGVDFFLFRLVITSSSLQIKSLTFYNIPGILNVIQPPLSYNSAISSIASHSIHFPNRLQFNHF